MLHELQSGFMAAVLAGSQTELTSATPKIREGKLNTAQRVAIYRRNVQSTLRGALGDIFPTTRWMLGDDKFLNVGDQFILHAPSTSGDLNQFGRSFPEFLSAMQPSAAADMATLDWAWHEAFHAAEQAALDLSRLGAVPAEQHAALVFQLHPSARLIGSAYPLLELWQAHQNSEEAPLEISKILPADHHFLAVHRDDANVTLTPLSAPQFHFLKNCAEHRPLGKAAEAAFALDASFALQAFLIQTVQQNIVIDFNEPS